MSIIRRVQKCHNEGKIYNAATNSCVEKDGSIGKSIILPPESLSVQMLREVLKERGIRGISNKKKDELIEMYNASSVPGKKVKSNLMNEEARSKKERECKEKGKVLNPATGRCNKIKKARSKPASPARSKPASPARSKPASPVRSKPASPALNKPDSPARSKPASPVVKDVYFRNLGYDMVVNIIKFLRIPELVNMYNTNKEMREIIIDYMTKRVSKATPLQLGEILLETRGKLNRQMFTDMVYKEIDKRGLDSSLFGYVGVIAPKGKFALNAAVIIGDSGDQARYIKYNAKKRLVYVGKTGKIIGYHFSPGSFSKYIVEFPDKQIEEFHSHFIFGL
jgi:hypothetical protein